MPDAKLTDLPVLSIPNANDKLYIVNNNLSKSITVNSLSNNLSSITTTGNANIGGDIVIQSGSSIIDSDRDYAWHVYDEINSLFTPSTGLQPVTIFTNYTIVSGQGHFIHALSSNVVPKLDVIVPNIPNYAGFTKSFIQLGTATIVISAGSGVNVGSLNSSLSSAGIYSKIDLTYLGNQLYTLTGDLSTSLT
jgi:hypothetical protein